MTSYICITCGIQYFPAITPPSGCIICDGDRQYINPEGQSWTTLNVLNDEHKNVLQQIAENLYAVYTVPAFGINQRAHLLRSPNGNILWDCTSNIDEVTVQEIIKLGGLKAIAISHPHYFSTITEWSKAFGNVPVYINALDKKWLTQKPVNLHLWNVKEQVLWDGITFICCGVHFPGASILYCPQNDGFFLTGDTIQVKPDLKNGIIHVQLS